MRRLTFKAVTTRDCDPTVSDLGWCIPQGGLNGLWVLWEGTHPCILRVVVDCRTLDHQRPLQDRRSHELQQTGLSLPQSKCITSPLLPPKSIAPHLSPTSVSATTTSFGSVKKPSSGLRFCAGGVGF
jgi:hypothetical protein